MLLVAEFRLRFRVFVCQIGNRCAISSVGEDFGKRIPEFQNFPKSFRFRNVCEILMEWNFRMETCVPHLIFYYRYKIGVKFRAIYHLHLWNEKKVKSHYSTWESTWWIVCHENKLPANWLSVTGYSSRVGKRTTFLFLKISNLSFSTHAWGNNKYNLTHACEENKYKVIKTHKLAYIRSKDIRFESKTSKWKSNFSPQVYFSDCLLALEYLEIKYVRSLKIKIKGEFLKLDVK